MPIYNNGFPATYQSPYYAQQAYQAPASTQSNGIVWVQGDAGARSFYVPAGGTALLMDSESQRFYIKTSDQSGMPSPLRVFEYSEIIPASHSDTKEIPYATKAEFEEFRNEINAILQNAAKRTVSDNGNSAVQRVE